MPEMNGIDLLSHLRQLDKYRAIPMVMLTTEGDREIRIEALSAGVNDFLNKPFDPFEFRARISNMLALRMAQKRQNKLVAYLANDVDKAMREINLREKELIWRLALAVDARDGGTAAHVTRVARVSYRLAKGMGLNDARCQLIYRAAPLHDVGKIGTPDAILGKPGPLTREEEVIMRRHVEHGVNILRDGETDLLRIAATIAGGHHERWDGSGYPAGLAGEAIPIEARIVAVADVFDALCTERSYKKALPFEEAFAVIVAGSGKHFDPACVEVFKRLKGELHKIRSEEPYF
jgi:putative two-component system response regulator